MRGAAQLEIVRLLADAGSVDEASHGVLAALATELGWDMALLWVVEDDALHRGPFWTRPDAGLEAFARACGRLTFEPTVGLPGRVWQSGKVEWVPDFPTRPDLPRSGIAADADLRSAVAVPMGAAGSPLGVIELLSRVPRSRDAEQEQLLRSAAGQLGHFVARARAEDLLLAAEERTAAIFDAALDAVITMDHEGRVVAFNPAAEEIFGYSRDEAAGQSLAELIVPPDLREAHRAGVARYLATGRTTILGRRLELTGSHADGHTFPVELTVTRLGVREPPLFAGFLRDITRRHEADAERARLIAEAERERRRLAFLVDADLRLAASLDYSTVLEGVARAAVPHVADLCVVVVAEAQGRLRHLALAHADPGLERTAREISERYPPDPAATTGIIGVIRTGRPQLLPDLGPDELRGLAYGDEQHARELEELGLRSALTVPIRASGRTLGAIALFRGAPGRPFGADDLTVATALAARAGLHIENARLYTERSQVAHTLQQSFLPAKLPRIPGLEVAAHYRAAGEQEVGGDFYDVFGSGDGAWTAFIGDVAGKGAAAAALTALTRHTLYATSLTETSPARNLELLNEAMRRRAHTGSAFCTVLYARLRPGEHETAVTLASGGHPSPLILRADGTVEPVPTPGTLVGAVDEATTVNREATLGPGDLMLLYTDGAVELRRTDLAFGQRALEQALRDSVGRPAEEVVSALARRVDELQDGSPRDDVALLALRMLPPG
jgi:PAS domain S-box-containing protein